METKKIYCSISHDQHAYFLAARIFHPGKRDKAICAFIDEVRRIIGNIVYDEDKKTVGEYLRQLARDLNASHKSSFDIFIEPLKKSPTTMVWHANATSARLQMTGRQSLSVRSSSFTLISNYISDRSLVPCSVL